MILFTLGVSVINLIVSSAIYLRKFIKRFL